MVGGSGRGPGSQAAPGLAESRPLSIRHNNTQIHTRRSGLSDEHNCTIWPVNGKKDAADWKMIDWGKDLLTTALKVD